MVYAPQEDDLEDARRRGDPWPPALIYMVVEPTLAGLAFRQPLRAGAVVFMEAALCSIAIPTRRPLDPLCLPQAPDWFMAAAF